MVFTDMLFIAWWPGVFPWHVSDIPARDVPASDRPPSSLSDDHFFWMFVRIHRHSLHDIKESVGKNECVLCWNRRDAWKKRRCLFHWHVKMATSYLTDASCEMAELTRHWESACSRQYLGPFAELGFFHIIFAFCITRVMQNAKMIWKNPSSAFGVCQVMGIWQNRRAQIGRDWLRNSWKPFCFCRGQLGGAHWNANQICLLFLFLQACFIDEATLSSTFYAFLERTKS